MTTLTPNRILQQGDEYRNNGTWKAVPKEDYGLQVMFTKYAEVRRPDEEPPKHNLQQGSETVTRHAHNVEKAGSTPAPAKISPVSEKPKAVKPSAIVTATAEKEKSPAPTPSGAGEPHPSSYLPTVISKKAHGSNMNVKAKLVPMTPEQLAIQAEAHSQESDRAIIAKIPCDSPVTMTAEQQAALNREIERQPKLIPVKAAYDDTGLVKITFPKPDPTNVIEMCNQPVWTGRNGTFTGYGLEAMSLEGRINLCPIGKRGVGNCAIQFPKAIIPEIVDWLLRQQTTPT